MAEITPMMKQYLEIKEQNKDSILFFRLGDFYEMFNEDAQLASTAARRRRIRRRCAAFPIIRATPTSRA